MRSLKALLVGPMLGFCGLMLTACATAPSPEALAANDPFEASNRDMLVFNQQFDEIFFIPTVKRYLSLPETVRLGVGNFLRNLAAPTVFVNDVLQGKPERAGTTLVRFVLNSGPGLGGLFDPATRLGIPYHSEDFGQTLATWGVGEGPFVMLPHLGPNNPRDTVGLAMDTFLLDPTNYIHVKQHFWWASGRQYLRVLDMRTQTFETLQGIERSSVDYYASLRNLYRQVRDNEIRDGAPAPVADLPDF